MSQPPPNDLFKAAEQSLSQRDFHKCREYALAVPKSDPRFPVVDQILAIADTLIAGETKVSKAKDPDWYAILQLKRYCSSYDLIADQFKKLYSLLDPDKNRFPLANEAAELTLQAYFVLKDSSKRHEFNDELQESELPKANSAFLAVCTICLDNFMFDNKAYEGGVYKCEKCRIEPIKPIKPQPKNEPGMKWSLCSQCSELFFEIAEESITESTSSDDQEPGFICFNCTGNLDEPNIDSFSAYFPGGFDDGCEWIGNVLTGQENLTGGNQSVADHQIHVVEGGENAVAADTVWVSCPHCSYTFKQVMVPQQSLPKCQYPVCGKEFNVLDAMLLYQKEEANIDEMRKKFHVLDTMLLYPPKEVEDQKEEMRKFQD